MIKSLIYEETSGDSESENGFEVIKCFKNRVSNMFILALKESELELYSISPPAKLWIYNLSEVAAQRFASEPSASLNC